MAERIGTKEIEFIKKTGKRERNLISIGSRANLPRWECTRIADKLEMFRWIKTRKEGRQRFVKITKHGEYWKKKAGSILNKLVRN